MRVPDQTIKEAIAYNLSGLRYGFGPDSVRVPVYDAFAEPEAPHPHVVISSLSSSQQGAKSLNMYETRLSLQIRDRRINVGNATATDYIADTIMQILLTGLPTGNNIAVSGFKVWVIELQSSPSATYEVKPYKYTEKNLILTLKTEEL